MTDSNTRHSEFPVERLFLDRWSPRAFHPQAMPRDTLLTILDAAHWAPSSGNNQPWRFVYTLRDTQSWDGLLALLNPANQRWAQNASALVFIISKTYRLGKDGQRRDAYTHSFDTGSAWFSMAVQAMKLGYHAHGMEGFDQAKAAEALAVPEGYRLEAVAAIGMIADKATLPEDLREREAPNDRKPLNEVVFESRFSGDV